MDLNLLDDCQKNVFNYWFCMMIAWMLKVCKIELVIISGVSVRDFLFFISLKMERLVKAREFGIAKFKVSFQWALFVKSVLI